MQIVLHLIHVLSFCKLIIVEFVVYDINQV